MPGFSAAETKCKKYEMPSINLKHSLQILKLVVNLSSSS